MKGAIELLFVLRAASISFSSLPHREPVERDGGEVPDGGRADDGVGGHPDGAEEVAAPPPNPPAVRVVRAQRERHGANQEVSHRFSRERERRFMYCLKSILGVGILLWRRQGIF